MTGITVVYNTRDLFKRAYDSVREFMPETELIIVDGSEESNPCHGYVRSLMANPYNRIFQLNNNIGHGLGMHYGMEKCQTRTAFIFDSDIVMLKNPLSKMYSLLSSDTYGVGWVYPIGIDGFDYGTPGRRHNVSIPYLHPYFMLLNVAQYRNYHPFVHHGAPCYKAMIDLHNRKESHKLINFTGTPGHSTGHGINWHAVKPEYIQHDFGGTRKANTARGLKEIPGQWDR